MPTIDITAILKELETKIVDLAKTSFKELVNQATEDGKKLVETLKEDLVRWANLLADHQITKEEFETLLKGQRDLVKMTALTKAGTTLARIDQFKSAIFKIILDTVTSII